MECADSHNPRSHHMTILLQDGGATEKQVKAAYRKLSVQLHPDKNPGNESAHEIYLQVVKAHQTYVSVPARL